MNKVSKECVRWYMSQPSYYRENNYVILARSSDDLTSLVCILYHYNDGVFYYVWMREVFSDRNTLGYEYAYYIENHKYGCISTEFTGVENVKF